MTIIGAGLAGTELALQLARRGRPVRLIEQKPLARTAAQSLDGVAELVCSNSLRGAALSNAVGLLKEEMRRSGSFVLAAADATSVPAGGALAVDREQFSAWLTEAVERAPLIERVTEVVTELPLERPLVVATGPLTGQALAHALETRFGQGSLAYYDAIAPVVAADSIDFEKVFLASRWDKGTSEAEQHAYINCPLTEAAYEAFIDALLSAEKAVPHAFEEPRYFEGCLPIEVMAERGRKTLAFGPMKPAGLTDPKTGRWPHAVVQLRQENAAGTAYNLVGFQTRMMQAEQRRVFQMIPGLERAEFERYGSIHRNTFLDAPRLLDGFLRSRQEPQLFFAGQITGVEGYVESAACGLVCSFYLDDCWQGHQLELPPETTALGGLMRHLTRGEGDFQPSNVNFAMLPPVSLEGRKKLKKHERGELAAARALEALEAWLQRRRERAVASG